MSNDLISFLGWSFLPDLVTSNVQALYYKLTVRVGDPVPHPSSPTHAKHRRRIYIAVILLYLLYTLYEADWDVRRSGDFYADLGVPHDAEERTLQSRFRRLTLQYHPDKLPHSTSDAVRAQAEQHYVRLQLAKDTLVDPTKRFAYDRFGPDIVQWQQHCKSIKDYVYTGLRAFIPFYIVSAIVMLILGWMGFGDWGKYWRYLALLCLAVLELHTITRPSFTFITKIPTLHTYLLPASLSLDSLSALPFPLHLPSHLASLLQKLMSGLLNILSLPQPSSALFERPPYLPFQALRVAHRAAIAFFIALSRLGPMISASMRASSDADGEIEGEGETSEEAAQAAFARLENAVGSTGAEAVRLLALELVPFRNRDDGAGIAAGQLAGRQGRSHGSRSQAMEFLKGKVKGWFVTNTIRSDPQVREAVNRVVDRRKHVGQSMSNE